MADKKQNRSIVQSQGGVLHNVVIQTKLILRLLGDRRVSAWTKLIPLGTLVYLVSPLDIIMGIPGISALDDAAIVWFGSNLFIELCPRDVVKEHMSDLQSNLDTTDTDDVIDAESTDVK
ncbi:MAG: DUF1232 domain-containing protein [Anaerolineales bacterium]|nr:DUF1232 domain-containing protein [Anaerolineales bacterium]